MFYIKVHLSIFANYDRMIRSTDKKRNEAEGNEFV